ncbi:calaxin-like [Sabethes cyaneus]|uniref:calaxin-like n=1 Tax=Sabethes cyaneus TaxID=53552 RepID=UPI00237D60D6|nr:calaxin-like [Sabethes cyaneus]
MSLDLTLDASEEARFLNRISRLVKRLARKTHFTAREVEVCLLIYYKMVRADEGSLGGMLVSRHQLDAVFDASFGITDSATIGRIFTALDKSVTTHVTMETWTRMLSLFLRGTLDEKIDHCFRAYDISGEGLIRREHMMVLLKGCFIKQQEEDAEEDIKDLTELIIRQLDMDRDGAISLDDFREAVRKAPEMLECFGQALPDRPHVYAFSRTFLNRVSKY